MDWIQRQTSQVGIALTCAGVCMLVVAGLLPSRWQSFRWARIYLGRICFVAGIDLLLLGGFELDPTRTIGSLVGVLAALLFLQVLSAILSTEDPSPISKKFKVWNVFMDMHGSPTAPFEKAALYVLLMYFYYLYLLRGPGGDGKWKADYYAVAVLMQLVTSRASSTFDSETPYWTALIWANKCGLQQEGGKPEVVAINWIMVYLRMTLSALAHSGAVMFIFLTTPLVLAYSPGPFDFLVNATALNYIASLSDIEPKEVQFVKIKLLDNGEAVLAEDEESGKKEDPPPVAEPQPAMQNSAEPATSTEKAELTTQVRDLLQRCAQLHLALGLVDGGGAALGQGMEQKVTEVSGRLLLAGGANVESVALSLPGQVALPEHDAVDDEEV